MSQAYVGESPVYNTDAQCRMYRECRALHPPKKGSDEYHELSLFSKEVEIILQTVRDDEYQAAITVLEPPSDNFERSIVFPTAGTVLGMLADHKVALIQTGIGSYSSEFIESAISTFIHANFIISIGACYAFDSSKYQFADVMVSRKISDLRNLKLNEHGEVVDRGETIDVIDKLKSVFCMDMMFNDDFIVSTDGRLSTVHCGRYISYSAELANKEMRERVHRAAPEAIGGDMEGRELLRLQQKRKIEGIIVIKGVAGYADGRGGKEWQFTAALAALKYTQSKLYYYQSQSSTSKTVGTIDSSFEVTELLCHYQHHLQIYYKESSVKENFSIDSCDEFIDLIMVAKQHEESIEQHKFNLDNIFIKPNMKFVLIEGAPGIGKSTLCKELCRKWDSLQSLQQFKIVLYLRLREKAIQNANSVNDLFRLGNKQFYSEEKLKIIVDEILRREGDEALLIMDGLDELPNSVVYDKNSLILDLLCCKCIPNAARLVTSRPSGLHLKSLFPKHHKHIEILGWSERSKIKFAEISLKSDPDILSLLKTHIFSNPIVDSFMLIPLNSAIVVQVYKEIGYSHELVPKTMTELYTILVVVLIRKYMIDKGEWNEESVIPTRLKSLPENIFTCLTSICALAYEGIMQEHTQLEFSTDEVGGNFDHLGLMTTTKQMYLTGPKVTYSFLHLSMQEFLAACHVSFHSNSVDFEYERLCLFFHHKGAYERFFAGLVDYRTWLKPVEYVEDMTIFHCLYEAQNISAFNLFQSDRYDVTLLNSLDAFVFGYAFCNTSINWEVRMSSQDFQILNASLVQNLREDSLSVMKMLEFRSENSSHIFPKLQGLSEYLCHSIRQIQFTINAYTADIKGFVSGIPRLENLSCTIITISATCRDDSLLFRALKQLQKLKEVNFEFQKKCEITCEGKRELLDFFRTSMGLQSVKLFFYDNESRFKSLLNWRFRNLVIKSALSCSKIETFTTNFPFLVQSFPSTLKFLNFEITTKEWSSKFFNLYSLTELCSCIFCIAENCGLSSLTFLNIINRSAHGLMEWESLFPNKCFCCSLSPKMYSNFLATMNLSLQRNSTIKTINLNFCNYKPQNNICLLSEALQKGRIKRTKSISDLVLPFVPKLTQLSRRRYKKVKKFPKKKLFSIKKSKSCPELHNLQTLRRIDPVLPCKLFKQNFVLK